MVVFACVCVTRVKRKIFTTPNVSRYFQISRRENTRGSLFTKSTEDRWNDVPSVFLWAPEESCNDVMRLCALPAVEKNEPFWASTGSVALSQCGVKWDTNDCVGVFFRVVDWLKLAIVWCRSPSSPCLRHPVNDSTVLQSKMKNNMYMCAGARACVCVCVCVWQLTWSPSSLLWKPVFLTGTLNNFSLFGQGKPHR